jgi:hypothetical protein
MIRLMVVITAAAAMLYITVYYSENRWHLVFPGNNFKQKMYTYDIYVL